MNLFDERYRARTVYDCDTCLEPGTCPPGEPMPDGWVEDTNGHHCPKCYPKEWAA